LHKLECGIVTRTQSSEALYIPSGCIHATYTTKGGFLVAKDFVTRSTFRVIVSLIGSEYFKVFDSESRELCLDWFITSLEIAVQHQKLLAVLEAWIDVESMLRSLSPKLLLRVSRRAKGCFEDALGGITGTAVRCPCGWGTHSVHLGHIGERRT
jgi:hypothetical protein